MDSELISLLYWIGDGRLVKVKVDFLESAACVKEHIPLLVPLDACILKPFWCLCCNEVSIDDIVELKEVEVVVFAITAVVCNCGHRFRTGRWCGFVGLLVNMFGFSSVSGYRCPGFLGWC